MGWFKIRGTAAGFVFDLENRLGEIIAVSQTYKTVKNALHGAGSVQKTAPKAHFEDRTVPDYKKDLNPRFELEKNDFETYQLSLRAKNGQVILLCQDIPTKEAALSLLEAIRKTSQTAKIIQI
ncbi:MAG: DUF1508 domain-containing protein [Lachnospiraceae bacterium]|nr:DUF1508 domain-containing protein [Lachnospiraceae bacterium]